MGVGGGILVVLFERGTSAHCEQYHSLSHIEGERLLCIHLSLLSSYGYDMNICFEVLTLWLPCHHELYIPVNRNQLVSLQRPLPGWFVCHLFSAQHWSEVKALILPTAALRCSVPSCLRSAPRTDHVCRAPGILYTSFLFCKFDP